VTVMMPNDIAGGTSSESGLPAMHTANSPASIRWWNTYVVPVGQDTGGVT
jgi:hypothetical protein